MINVVKQRKTTRRERGVYFEINVNFLWSILSCTIKDTEKEGVYTMILFTVAIKSLYLLKCVSLKCMLVFVFQTRVVLYSVSYRAKCVMADVKSKNSQCDNLASV